MSGQRGTVSFGKLALFSLGAATAVLALTTIVIGVLRPGPVVGLIVVLVGVVCSIAAMGIVSTRMTRNALGPRTSGESDPEAGPSR